MDTIKTSETVTRLYPEYFFSFSNSLLVFLFNFVYCLCITHFYYVTIVHFYMFQDSTIRRGFGPSFVNYKKGCIRLAAASDKVYQLLAQGRWFSPGTSATSTTKTGRHDIAEILLKVALNTNIQNSNSKCKIPNHF